MKRYRVQRTIFSAPLAVAYGIYFYWLTERGRPSLLVYTGGRTDCCERCSNLLYDNAQPTLALCAGIAFFLYLLFVNARLGLRNILQTVGLCLISFQLFNIWTARHLLIRTECTALYSPGPLFIIGIIIVPLVLLYQSLVWSLICAAPMLMISGVRQLLRVESESAS